MKAATWCCLLLACSQAAAAEHARVLLDGRALTTTTVEAAFLLPDGSILTHDRLIRACSHLQISGLLYYRPDSDHCQPLHQINQAELPDARPAAGKILVFNRLTRETCSPGHCQVVFGGAAGWPGGGPVMPVSIDSLTATPDSREGPGMVTLAWTSSSAEQCSLQDDQGSAPEAVALSGSIERLVTSTTVFSLSCINASSSDTAMVEVIVIVSDPIFADRFAQPGP
jgi:hypothetical protein